MFNNFSCNNRALSICPSNKKIKFQEINELEQQNSSEFDLFLKDKAEERGFPPMRKKIFLYVFHPNNRGKTYQELGDEIFGKDDFNRRQRILTELSRLYCVFRRAGANIDNSKRGRPRNQNSPFEQAFQWLWKAEFPKWQAQRNNFSPNLYVPRPFLEKECYQALDKGGFLRIKGISGIGKTTLIKTVLNQLIDNMSTESDIININCSTILNEIQDLNDLESFCRSLCRKVAKELSLDNQYEQFTWKDINPTENTTSFFKDIVLSRSENPLILIFDKTEKVFETQQIANNLCQMLTGWLNEGEFKKIWQRIRLVIIHATDNHFSSSQDIPFDITCSSLKEMGKVIELTGFDYEQVQDLAIRHNSKLEVSHQRQLRDFLAGHPARINEALTYLTAPRRSFEEFLRKAPTYEGIYKEHLMSLLEDVQKISWAKDILKQIVSSSQPVQVENSQKIVLSYLGLVKFSENDVLLSCDLYRLFFQKYFERYP